MREYNSVNDTMEISYDEYHNIMKLMVFSDHALSLLNQRYPDLMSEHFGPGQVDKAIASLRATIFGGKE